MDKTVRRIKSLRNTICSSWFLDAVLQFWSWSDKMCSEEGKNLVYTVVPNELESEEGGVMFWSHCERTVFVQFCPVGGAGMLDWRTLCREPRRFAVNCIFSSLTPLHSSCVFQEVPSTAWWKRRTKLPHEPENPKPRRATRSSAAWVSSFLTPAVERKGSYCLLKEALNHRHLVRRGGSEGWVKGAIREFVLRLFLFAFKSLFFNRGSLKVCTM